MPAPVVSILQSVLGFLQWQPWKFQPTATGSPTGWQVSALPPGVTFNSTTGAIQGPATMPGVYLFQLTAINASGPSAPETFALGIEASGFVQPSNILEAIIDITSRKVFVGLTLADMQAAGARAANATADDDRKISAACYLKAGDDVLINLRFVKNGVVAPVSLSQLKLTLKEFEPDGAFGTPVEFPLTWQPQAGGADSAFRLHFKLEGDLLRGVLSNYESDTETSFMALAEIEWQEANPTFPLVGPAVIRSSSRTFGVHITRDLTPN